MHFHPNRTTDVTSKANSTTDITPKATEM